MFRFIIPDRHFVDDPQTANSGLRRVPLRRLPVVVAVPKARRPRPARLAPTKAQPASTFSGPLPRGRFLLLKT
ncbi:MAG: hypothetical protein AAGL89_16490, partial [Pseudomonadota bacterium]